MHLKKIHLQNFRNYKEKNLSFESPWIWLEGKNGIGKTNILDAIAYLCMTKPYFSTALDQQSIRDQSAFFSIAGDFENAILSEKIVCTYEDQKGKQLYQNQKKYERFSAHIGKYPLVAFCPNDQFLLFGGAEERRRFLDVFLSQLSLEYLFCLQEYKKILKNRNSLLKNNPYSPKMMDYLEIMDEKMIIYGKKIFAMRLEKIKLLAEKTHFFYQKIAGGNKNIKILLESDQQNMGLSENIKKNRRNDFFKQSSSVGPHKDDVLFLFEEKNIKKRASQGEQKSFLLALKLAEYQILSHHLNKNPFLLLDDLWDKIDEERFLKLCEVLEKEVLGQIFITHTGHFPMDLREKNIQKITLF